MKTILDTPFDGPAARPSLAERIVADREGTGAVLTYLVIFGWLIWFTLHIIHGANGRTL